MSSNSLNINVDNSLNTALKQSVVIILGAGKNQVPIYKYFSRKNLLVIGIDQDRTAPGLSLADHSICRSTYEADPVLEALHEYNEQYNYIGLIARSSGPAMHTAALITQKYGLPGITTEFAQLATRKSALRKFCHINGLNFPRGTQGVAGRDELLEYPLICKPDYPLVGKQHIRVITDPDDLQPAMLLCERSSYDGKVEVEHFLKGPDVSVAVILEKGRVIVFTDWDEYVGISRDGSIKGLGVQCPSLIHDLPMRVALERIIQKVADQFPKLQSFVIFSFRLVDETPYLIEIHADLGGDGIAEQVLNRAFPDFDFFKAISDYYCVGDYSQFTDLSQPVPTAWLPNSKNILQRDGYEENLQAAMDIFNKWELKEYPDHYRWVQNHGQTRGRR